MFKKFYNIINYNKINPNIYISSNNNNIYNDLNLKKYMLDSTYKSMEKYKNKLTTLDKTILNGFQTYANFLEKSPNNIFGLILGILGFTITYKYIKN